MTNPCSRDKEIAQLYKVLIDGNGQPSVVQQLAELNTNMKGYMKRQEDLIKEFGITSREFYQFQATVIATDKVRVKEGDERHTKNRWAVGIVVVVIMGLLGLVSTWALSAKKDTKTLKAEVDNITPVNLRGSNKTSPVKDKKDYLISPAHADSIINMVNGKK